MHGCTVTVTLDNFSCLLLVLMYNYYVHSKHTNIRYGLKKLNVTG